jgi:hypothetical protein
VLLQNCESFRSPLPKPPAPMGSCAEYGSTAQWDAIIHRPLPD